MAKSRWEYVKRFEVNDSLLPRTWLVVRVDGCSFHKFSDDHNFAKPNDVSALHLMNFCARKVMEKFENIRFAYGQSDEYSFVFPPRCNPYNRRISKLSSIVASTFAVNYSFHWSHFFPQTSLKYPPSFDGRVVQYPTVEVLRDYLNWRQADCHINNLYNTTLWALIHGGLSPNEATKRLTGTNSGEKNEILFSDFKVNYNDEPELFKKGTFLFRKRCDSDDFTRTAIEEVNTSIINDKLWNEFPYLLES